jgi:hypothetical protein
MTEEQKKTVVHKMVGCPFSFADLPADLAQPLDLAAAVEEEV